MIHTQPLNGPFSFKLVGASTNAFFVSISSHSYFAELPTKICGLSFPFFLAKTSHLDFLESLVWSRAENSPSPLYTMSWLQETFQGVGKIWDRCAFSAPRSCSLGSWPARPPRKRRRKRRRPSSTAGRRCVGFFVNTINFTPSPRPLADSARVSTPNPGGTALFRGK